MRTCAASSPRRFISLRTKFIGGISLIIVVTCSDLGWFFANQEMASLSRHVVSTGTLLASTLAHQSRAGLMTEDPLLLGQIAEAYLDFENVRYVVILAADGQILAAKSRQNPPRRAAFPPSELGRHLLDAPAQGPAITALTLKEHVYAAEHRYIDPNQPPSIPIFDAGDALVYDFALAVPRASGRVPPIAAGGDSTGTRSAPRSSDRLRHPPLGAVQVGLDTGPAHRSLTQSVLYVSLLTIVIILCGIITAIVLARQVTGPLRQLAVAAQRVGQGDLSAMVPHPTPDEVGQLAQVFNWMTLSLKDQLTTVTRQVRALRTLQQTSLAITSTLEVNRLLDTVLQLLIENLGFSRMLLVLYDAERKVAVPSRIAGVPAEVAHAAQHLEVPVRDDHSTDAALLLHGQPILIPDLTAAADRIHPALLALAQEAGVHSYVAAPLKSNHGILGYLAADKPGSTCTQDDLDWLSTVASHVAVALDNASMYQKLEHLTQTLERRVSERTLALQTANERLKELDSQKSTFVSIVSHELRTPMTSIKGYVENMLEGLTGPLTEKQTHYLSRVRHNADRLTRLLNDLLDLARIEAGRLRLRLMPVNIPEMVRESVEAFRGAAHERGILLQGDCATDLAPLDADRDKLIQILTNLIQNAIKFTPPGGRVQVGCQLDGDRGVQFRVRDTGPGIPAAESERVFEKFYRGASTPANTHGAGLGLAIARSLVELHGGRIHVENTHGAGTSVLFTLPRRGDVR